ncbi:MAG: alkaline phosphatase family protein [Tissierellia bacterium]|nr:alkaline phosphatase family protein [Tissierellia bacterium]
MNRLLLLLLLLLLFLFFTACSLNLGEEDYQAICIFNEDENLKENFIPEEKTYIKDIYEDFSTAALICNRGEIIRVSDNFYLDKDKRVFVLSEGQRYENIVGIYLTNKYYSITDTYRQMKEYMEKDKKVMTVLLDGFSYNQFKLAQEKDYIPFLSEHFKNTALSIYTPVTNAGFAAIITGQTPDINGVHDRSVREMKVGSIFEYSLQNNKKALLLEGDIKILNTEIEPLLHIDLNKDGDTDDEIYESALNAVKEDYDLIFIHFHGIDDRGHSYGPYARETMDYIKTIDQYLQELSLNWEGVIILVPDHGMHESKEGGNHGICTQSDMVVPYFIKDE